MVKLLEDLPSAACCKGGAEALLHGCPGSLQHAGVLPGREMGWQWCVPHPLPSYGSPQPPPNRGWSHLPEPLLHFQASLGAGGAFLQVSMPCPHLLLSPPVSARRSCCWPRGAPAVPLLAALQALCSWLFSFHVATSFPGELPINYVRGKWDQEAAGINNRWLTVTASGHPCSLGKALQPLSSLLPPCYIPAPPPLGLCLGVGSEMQD